VQVGDESPPYDESARLIRVDDHHPRGNRIAFSPALEPSDRPVNCIRTARADGMAASTAQAEPRQ
jgi:hypothetical protein